MNRHKDQSTLEQTKMTYFEKGWVGPIDIFSKSEIDTYSQELLKIDLKYNLMKSDYRCKSNVLFPWVDELTRHPKILQHVQNILGPNLHCWDVLFWIKNPEDQKNVSFHQDATYWNFTPKDKALTVWIPFDDVGLEQGPVEYIDAPHEFKQVEHSDIKTQNNLLMRGQTVSHEIVKTIPVPCPKGSVLMHSPFIIHGSGANRSKMQRRACGILYVSTECKPIINKASESTIMVAGVDQYNFMQHDPRPQVDQWEQNLKNWQQAYDRQHTNYYALTQKD